jgi:hypothetical protein
LRAAVVDARGHAIAVELDLMHPLRPRRRLLDRLGKLRGTKIGRVAPRRDRLDLTVCEGERLTTRDTTGNPTRRNCHAPLTLLSGDGSIDEGEAMNSRETKLAAALDANTPIRVMPRS